MYKSWGERLSPLRLLQLLQSIHTFSVEYPLVLSMRSTDGELLPVWGYVCVLQLGQTPSMSIYISNISSAVTGVSTFGTFPFLSRSLMWL